MGDSVLVACRPVAIQAARIALGDDFDLTFVHDVNFAVKQVLTGTYSVVVGTLQFDESRLFELLETTKEIGMPIIATKLTVSHLSSHIIENWFHAAALSGFDAQINYQDLEQSVGEQKAQELFRATVAKFASRTKLRK